MTLAQQAKKLKALRIKEREAKKKADELKAEREKQERDLMDRMELEETESLRTDGTLFVPTKTIYSQIQDSAEFIQWAQENDIELVETKPRKGLVHELVREKLDNGEPLPPGIGFYVDEYISQRAA